MSISAFNGSLSFVFLESAVHENARGLGADFPKKIWDEAIDTFGGKNLYQTEVDVVRTKASVLRSGSEQISLTSNDDGSYHAYAAAFDKAADARAFYEALDRLLQDRKSQHAVRETARLNEGGKIRVLGFQF